jgi:hypothetical protein
MNPNLSSNQHPDPKVRAAADPKEIHITILNEGRLLEGGLDWSGLAELGRVNSHGHTDRDEIVGGKLDSPHQQNPVESRNTQVIARSGVHLGSGHGV